MNNPDNPDPRVHDRITCPSEMIASYGLSLAYIMNVFGEMAFIDFNINGMQEKHESTT
jgi:hypothetical protein